MILKNILPPPPLKTKQINNIKNIMISTIITMSKRNSLNKKFNDT